MRGQGDRIEEGAGYPVAMLRYMLDLSDGEPHFQQEAGRQAQREGDGQQPRGGERRILIDHGKQV